MKRINLNAKYLITGQLGIFLMGIMFFFAQSTAAQNLQGRAGKIWLDNNFLYVNFLYSGVLVIDNSNPKAPEKIGFIEIPGNVDMAVIGNIMYANSHRDLVAIDITDLENPQELSRNEGVFSHQPLGNGNNQAIAWRSGTDLNALLNSMLRNISQNGNLIGENGLNFGIQGLDNQIRTSVNQTSSATSGSSGTGKGGSMACFTIKDGYLYAVDATELHVFDLGEVSKPKKVGDKIRVGTGIETIFNYGEKLFIGSQLGMFIYDISNRVYPKREGSYQHTRSCDPVVVEGDYAYVTLHDAVDCGGGVNQLDVIDISNPRNPKKVRTFNMTNPHGLGIDNGTLFVCDGRDGLKVYDTKNPLELNRNQLAHFPNIDTYDVIPDSNREILIMVGDDKIKQYDYRNPKNITILSDLNLREDAK